MQPSERPTVVRINIFLAEQVDLAVEVAAAQRRTNKSKLVENAIRAYLGLDAA